MITIRNFEDAITPLLDMNGPALNQRNRELRRAGLILRSDFEGSPRGRGAVHLTPSDAAYVLLAAAADSTPSEVVEVASTLAGLTWGKDAPGDQRGGLRRHLNPEWSTFHAALTDIVAGKLVAAIHLVTIRPHLRQAEINLTFGFGSNDPVKSTLNFSNFDTLSADRLRSYTSMNTAFEIGPQFIAEVQTLIAQGDSGEMVPE